MQLKLVTFQGDSLDRLRDFPTDARQQAGQELYRVQTGRDPIDWKPMQTIGSGVREIRLRDASGAFRVIYVATFADAVHVLHAFQKKSQKTAPRDLDLVAIAVARPQTRVEIMKTKTFANVWDALSDSPEEAATMKIRSDVMIAIHDTVRAWDTTQAQAASRLGVTQPRLNDLLQGKINKFSLDTLLTLAGRAGLKVKINIRNAA
jgi:phage-related protein/predicted XRE-type DNA-binding protein